MAGSEIRDAYDRWAGQYDTDDNPTRDLNARVLRKQAIVRAGDVALELGCGTGLNTEVLVERAERVVATDFSESMLRQARSRLSGTGAELRRLDVREPWPFQADEFDVVIITLVLEHVRDLAPVFQEAARVLHGGGLFYVSELHPDRQREGAQATFRDELTGKRVMVPSVQHTLGEFVFVGRERGFSVMDVAEWQTITDEAPRLLSLLFER